MQSHHPPNMLKKIPYSHNIKRLSKKKEKKKSHHNPTNGVLIYFLSYTLNLLFFINYCHSFLIPLMNTNFIKYVSHYFKIIYIF
jgi:hypothetical protein